MMFPSAHHSALCLFFPRYAWPFSVRHVPTQLLWQVLDGEAWCLSRRAGQHTQLCVVHPHNIWAAYSTAFQAAHRKTWLPINSPQLSCHTHISTHCSTSSSSPHLPSFTALPITKPKNFRFIFFLSCLPAFYLLSFCKDKVNKKSIWAGSPLCDFIDFGEVT